VDDDQRFVTDLSAVAQDPGVHVVAPVLGHVGAADREHTLGPLGDIAQRKVEQELADRVVAVVGHGEGRLYAGGLLGGLTTQEIARAFLVGEPTVAQRIVRAKPTLAEAHVAFEVPRGDPLGLRLESVLEVVYLIFNEGKSATAGDDWMRPALCAEALRLKRILAELAPGSWRFTASFR